MADGVRAMWHPRWDFQCKFHLMTLKVFIQRRASRPIIWEFTRGLASNIFMSLKRSWKASREPDLNTLKQSLQATHRSKTGTSDPRRATNGPNHRDDKQNVLRAAAIMLGWLTKRLGFLIEKLKISCGHNCWCCHRGHYLKRLQISHILPACKSSNYGIYSYMK